MARVQEMWRTLLIIALGLIVTVLFYLLWAWPRSGPPPVGEMQSFITEDGGRVAYYLSGPETGQPVVLLASLGRSVSDYNDLVQRLQAEGFRTIAIDMPGVGKSRLPEELPQTLYDLAAVVDTAIQNAGVGQNQSVSVIGHAFGNRLARVYASANPGKVDRIILVAAGGSQNLEETPEVLNALISSFSRWLPPPVRHGHVKFAFFADGNDVPSAWRNGWHGNAARYQGAAVRRTPETEWRTGGDRPILILQAAEDRVAPAATTSSVIADSNPELVSIHRIEGAGHALLPERPDEIAGAIIDYLSADLPVE